MAISIMMVIAVAVVILPLIYGVAIATVWARKQKKIGEAVDKFPGLDKHWLIGYTTHHFPGFDEAGVQWMHQQVARFQRITRIWMSPFHPFVDVFHPETIKAVMKTSEPKQWTSMSGYQMVKPWLGDGLLLSRGEKWFRNRRLLTPAFHFEILKPYMLINNQATDVLLDKWSRATSQGQSVEIYKDICLLTLNIILRCAFSYDIDVQMQGENHPYVKAVNRVSRLVMERVLNPLVYSDFLYGLTPNGREFNRHLKLLHQTTTDLIAKRKLVLNTTKDDPRKKYLDFLDILLLARDEDGTGLTDQEIKDEADTFLFEGHDTTGSAISWALYSLAEHPEIQQKCREEIQRALQDKDYMEWEDLQKIPFTTMCIKEALRVHSPVPIIGRQLTSPLEIDDVTLLPGTMINMSIHLLHHNPVIWGPDHEEFKPERFSPENMKTMDPYAFVPFSAGPRNCIGQNFAMHEIKVVVCRVLKKFRISLDPSHTVGHRLDLVMRAENGIKFFMEPLQ